MKALSLVSVIAFYVVAACASEPNVISIHKICPTRPLTSAECGERLSAAAAGLTVDPHVDWNWDGVYGVQDIGQCKSLPDDNTIPHLLTCTPMTARECNVRLQKSFGKPASFDSAMDTAGAPDGGPDGTIGVPDLSLCRQIGQRELSSEQ